MVEKEAKTPCETCTYVVESFGTLGHHVSKDICTPVISEVCSGSKEGKFGGRTRAQKTSAVPCCFLDCNYYSYCKGQPLVF